MNAVLQHLERLVAIDTRNPPRAIDGEGELVRFLRGALPEGFDFRVTDHGEGRVSIFARRGEPSILFNVHLDTVPSGADWVRDPLRLGVEGARAYGLGACDIKGAAACLLDIANTSDAPMALLFTTDEEGAQGCCVNEFVAAGHHRAYRVAVVAEPTGCGAVTRHRGYLSVKGRFRGEAGHSSEPRALADNALHRAGRWAAAALAEAEADEAAGARSCFNLGLMSGGTKSNVIADRADLHWSARLPPGSDSDNFLERLCAAGGADAEWHVPFLGPSLPEGDADDAAARAFVAECGLDVAPPVDFWTEASLFARGGLPALVLGPGDITQAHAADEWVELAQLERARAIYANMVSTDARTA